MKLKSFFADTIEEAISQARREMGADAMLVNSKRSGTEARHLGAFEVVCAADVETRPQEAKAGRAGLSTVPRVDRLSQEVSELKQQMERLALTLARSGGGMKGIAADPELSKLFALLTGAELEAELAYELIGNLSFPVSGDTLRGELGRLVSVDQELGCPGAPYRAVAFAGPPGVGKTSALVKMAVQHGVLAKRSTQILSLDTIRVAAADELRAYAAILGIGFQVLETPAALGQALEEHRQKGLILIDTPGLSRDEMESFDDFIGFLASNPGIDTHLVLAASMRASDLKRIANQYSVFQPRKLLFTRLDETETFGPILSQSVRMKKPLSFFSNGQRIPEDLKAASLDEVLDLVIKAEALPASQFGTAAA